MNLDLKEEGDCFCFQDKVILWHFPGLVLSYPGPLKDGIRSLELKPQVGRWALDQVALKGMYPMVTALQECV